MTTFSGAVSDFLTGVGIDSTNLGYLTDAVQALSDAPSSYTPAWTSSGTAPVLNNGTLTGTYIQVGKLVIGQANLIMGSTTTFGTGNYRLSVPIAMTGSASTRIFGDAILYDNSTTTTAFASMRWQSSTTLDFRADAGTGQVANATPWTWAQSDRFEIAFLYWTT